MTIRARLYQPPRTAMQSGTAGTAVWVLDYLSSTPRAPDPLMGWSGGADTNSQVRLKFETQAEAVAFAQQNGIAYDLELPHARKIKPKAYADNFKVTRWENWTH